jgi:segregation and condensation protein A
MNQNNGYTISLKQFEGPFDLLLFFIQRDEIDIYDIPISKITSDFLAYIKHLEEMNLDVASEFILMAATLMRIKAKMLLPRKELDEEGNEIDPRQDLVQQLIEYKKYKDILDDMRDLEEKRSQVHNRASASKELRKIAEKALVDVEMESITLFKLLKAFESVVAKFEERKKAKVHTVIKYSFTIDEQKSFILQRIGRKQKTDFKSLFSEMKNRIHAIVTFLALLELLNIEKISIIIGEGTNNFWLKVSNDQ